MALRSKLQSSTELGRNLAAVRLARGWTQEQVAERLGVDMETISRTERGVNWPTLPRLLSLADLYDVSISSLLQHSSSRAKDIAEDLQDQLDQLTEEDRVWVRQWFKEMCERLAIDVHKRPDSEKQRHKSTGRSE
ncbi:helix-turn-helix domain-containing protein [Ralstonia sp. 25C]|uniref:helix-turn-helix domain-containing protein n=1 Tax=Ralstonia sp. 25C TaxID=3447363 RepID=UPI003F754EC5